MKKMSRTKKKSIKHIINFLQQPRILKKIGLYFASSIIIFFLILYGMPRPSYSHGFRNLAELQAYAQQYEDIVPMSNQNTLRPEFDQHYEQFKPTLGFILKEKLHYIATRLHLAKPPVFSPSFFKHLITTLTQERKNKGLINDTIICKIRVGTNAKCIIWGNLQASFHSLVRDFTHLKSIGLIDDNLKLIQPDTYAFFTGNVVSRSCYSMETMAAVARFTQVNPDRAFYLQGNHERDNYWQEHTLKTELQIKASHLSSSPIPLEKEVNQFFETLPEAAYIAIPGTTDEFIRISYAPRTGKTSRPLLQEKNYASFLVDQSSPTVSYKVIKPETIEQSATQPIKVRVIFRDEKKRETFQPMEGLRFLAPDIDSVAWNILSCPNYVFQRAIKFKHDAFVVLAAGHDITQWTLTLYSRDATTQEPFKATVYNLLSGVNMITNQQIERDAPKKDPLKKKKKKSSQDKKPARSLIPSSPSTPQIPIPQEEPEAIAAPATPPSSATVPQEGFIPPPPPGLTPPPITKTPPTQHNAHPQHIGQIQPKEEGIITPTTSLHETLEKIHNTMLHMSTTLDRIEKKVFSPKEAS